MEPTVQTLSGSAPSLVLKRYLLATRPMFMTASVMPVILGTCWGANAVGSLDALAFLLAILVVVLVHGAVNVLNDVYDDEIGTDRLNEERVFPYTGGSRFIQNQVLTATQMRRWGLTLLVLAIAFGFLLSLYKGPLVIAFGLGGILAGVLYSMPPVQLSARGIGEIVVGFGFGVLPVTGATWLQTGSLGWPSLLLSLPVSIWVANILLINGVPDAVADRLSGKHTLAVRLGVAGTGTVYSLTSIIALLLTALATAVLDLSLWTPALPLLLMFLGLYAGHEVRRTPTGAALKRPIEITLFIHTAGTLWLSLWAWSSVT